LSCCVKRDNCGRREGHTNRSPAISKSKPPPSGGTPQKAVTKPAEAEIIDVKPADPAPAPVKQPK